MTALSKGTGFTLVVGIGAASCAHMHGTDDALRAEWTTL